MRLLSITVTLLLLSVGAYAETQSQHDKRTNFDGYGSAQNRYENLIMMKTHTSILMDGKLAYWNSLDEYDYRKNSLNRRSAMRRDGRWRAR